MKYLPGDTPEGWYTGQTMTVATDRVAFHDDVCIGPTYTMHRGRLSKVLATFSESRRDVIKRDFGVLDAGPFEYVEVRCQRGQYVDPAGKQSPLDAPAADYHPWYIVLRSATKIEMPFTHGTWIELSRNGPTS